jgi:hypothetical protein
MPGRIDVIVRLGVRTFLANPPRKKVMGRGDITFFIFISMVSVNVTVYAAASPVLTSRRTGAASRRMTTRAASTAPFSATTAST